jgi:hypothetical protein
VNRETGQLLISFYFPALKIGAGRREKVAWGARMKQALQGTGLSGTLERVAGTRPPDVSVTKKSVSGLAKWSAVW